MKIIPWSWHEASENRDAFALLRPYQKKEKKIRRGAYVYQHNVLKITYIFTEIEKYLDKENL